MSTSREARAVVVTGITGLLGAEPQQAALALLEGATGLRAVDPHLRPGLWGSDRGRELVFPLIANCDLALGGEHELRHLVGEDDVTVRGEALARRILELGPAEVVVKRGSEGAGALDRGRAMAPSIPPRRCPTSTPWGPVTRSTPATSPLASAAPTRPMRSSRVPTAVLRSPG